eukprot:6361925-Heterocapsa_arctica.AAC.1
MAAAAATATTAAAATSAWVAAPAAPATAAASTWVEGALYTASLLRAAKNNPNSQAPSGFWDP